MQPPKVSILILNWNGCNDTVECLHSVEKIEYTNFETIIIDNGSTDGTVSLIRTQFPKIFIIENHENLGYAEGNNIGIRFALERNPEFIFILNNDTTVHPYVLKALVLAAEQYPPAGIVAPKIYLYGDSKKLYSMGEKWVPEKASFIHLGFGELDLPQQDEGVQEIDYASGCALFFRAKLASEIGLFDSRFFFSWEEADWCYRVKRAGYKILMEPAAVIYHKSSQSIQGPALEWAFEYFYMRNRFLWIEKNLRGWERLRAFVRCLRELYWLILERKRKDLSEKEKMMIKAKLHGATHYFMRRFGNVKNA